MVSGQRSLDARIRHGAWQEKFEWAKFPRAKTVCIIGVSYSKPLNDDYGDREKRQKEIFYFSLKELETRDKRRSPTIPILLFDFFAILDLHCPLFSDDGLSFVFYLFLQSSVDFSLCRKIVSCFELCIPFTVHIIHQTYEENAKIYKTNKQQKRIVY